MANERAGADADEVEPIAEPLLIGRSEVLEILDRVLRKESDLGEAYLFAVDVVDSSQDGTAKLQDETMLGPLRELASAPVLTHAIVEQVRARLRGRHEEGSA